MLSEKGENNGGVNFDGDEVNALVRKVAYQGNSRGMRAGLSRECGLVFLSSC